MDAQIDSNNPYCHYATNILTIIIKEYAEYEKVLGPEKCEQFYQFIAQRLHDIIYGNLLQIVIPDTSSSSLLINTAGLEQKKIGLKRLRSLEMIRQVLQTLQRYEQNEVPVQYLTLTLRKKILDSILYILESYPFCSISLQQGVEILKIL